MTARSPALGCAAWGAFGAAWAFMFLVFSIGAGYGSSDPLLLVYGAVLALGAVPFGLRVWGKPAAVYAGGYALLVCITLFLGTTVG